MRKIIYIIPLLFIKCSSKPVDYNEYILKDNIYQIVDSFTIENPDSKVYELFIDKIDPHNNILILFGGPTSLTAEENNFQNQSPLFSIPINNKNIDIYSGAERYINNTNRTRKNIPEELNYSQEKIYWIIKDSFNILTITKNPEIRIYPFMPIIKPFDLSLLNPPVIQD